MAVATTPLRGAAVAHDDHAADHGHEDYAARLRMNRLGMWLFFISEAFLFGALLATRFYLWGDTRPEVDQMVGLIVTSVLLLSSASMLSLIHISEPTRPY